MWFSTVQVDNAAFCFFFFNVSGLGGGGEAFPVTINIWSLLPCKQMHCRAFQLFCQRVGLQQQNEFSRIADIYPKAILSFPLKVQEDLT